MEAKVLPVVTAKQCVAEIDKNWNKPVKNDELIVVFQLGSSIPDSVQFPQLYEAIPIDQPRSTQQLTTASFFNPRPASYLDCSTLKPVSENTPSDNGRCILSSIILLARYLERVKYSKFLIVANLEFFDPENCMDEKWSKTLEACLGVQLLLKLPVQKHNSAGLVLVSSHKSKEKPSSKDAYRQRIAQMKSSFFQNVEKIRQLLAQNQNTESATKFLRFITSTHNFLILEQDRPWNDKVINILRVPSPPGYKILKFCQGNLRVSKDATTAVIQLWNRHKGSEQTVQTEKQISKALIDTLDWQLRSVLKESAENYTAKLMKHFHENGKPIEIGEQLFEILKLATAPCTDIESCDRFLKIVRIINVDVPPNQTNISKLKRTQEELCTLQALIPRRLEDVSEGLDLPGKQFMIFADRIQKQNMCILSSKLISERNAVCSFLSKSYWEMGQAIGEEYKKRLGESYLGNDARNETLKYISADLESLSSTCSKDTLALMDTFQNLWIVSECRVLESFQPDIVYELEGQHQAYENLLSKLEQTYRCCDNHGAKSIYKALAQKMNQVGATLMTCNEIMNDFDKDIQAFADNITGALFQHIQNNSHDAVDETYSEVNHIWDALQARKTSQIVSVVAEVKYAWGFFKRYCTHAKSKQKISETQQKLHAFCGSEMGRNAFQVLAKQTITVVSSQIFGKVFAWKQCLELIATLSVMIPTYEYHSTLARKYKEIPSIQTKNDLYIFIQNLENSRIAANLNTFKESAWQSLIETCIELVNRSTEKQFTKKENGVVELSGTYLRFSDLKIANLKRHKDLKQIRMFAKEKIFVDKEFVDYAGRQLQLVIICPNIEIVGKFGLVDLSGRNGENFEHPAANGIGYEPGSGKGMQGDNGMPGTPGDNGGHFTLVCNAINSIDCLIVICKGGNGGNGQQGGNGSHGKNGDNAVATDIPNGIGKCNGKPGYPGGNGGHGGTGGLPGFGGLAQILVLGTKKSNTAQIDTRDGAKGKDGIGGTGGKGGLAGNGIEREKSGFKRFFGVITENPLVSTERANSGVAGIKGANSMEQKLPTPKLIPENPGKAIAAFRKFIQTDTANSTKNQAAKDFLKRIDNNAKILGWVSLKDLTEELIWLTTKPDADKEKVLRLLVNFQNRVDLYRHQKQEKSILTLQTTQILNLLQAYSISTSELLQEQISGNNNGAQVINIQRYFEVIAGNIKSLQESSVSLKRHFAVSNHDSFIQEKCMNVDAHIRKSVLPALEKTGKNIQLQLQNCVKELRDLETQVDSDVKLRKLDIKLIQDACHLDSMKSNLKLFKSAIEMGFAISNFWPHPAFRIGLRVAGAVTDVLLKNVNGRYPENPELRPNLQLPDCINTTEIKDKTNEHQAQFELVAEFVEAHKEIKEVLSPFLSKFSKLVLSPDFSQMPVCQAEAEFLKVKILEELTKCIQSPEYSADLRKNCNLLLLKLAISSTAAQIPDDMPKDFTLNFVNDAELAIAQGQQLKILQNQKSIYQVLIPLVKSVTGSMITTSIQKESKTTDANKVDKWQMKLILADLKLKLQDFVKGLKAEITLLDSIHRFEEAFYLLLDLYDLLDKEENSKRFMQTIETLTNQSGSITDTIHDKALQRDVAQLEYNLRASVFMLDYNDAVSVFKQWVFPFASKYSEIISCTGMDHRQFEEGSDKHEEALKLLSAQFKQRFVKLNEHLCRYRAMTLNTDSVLFNGNFGTESKTNPPFYVWKWKEYPEVLANLLEGKEVELRADIWKACSFDAKRRGAVKFKTVELHIKHVNGPKSNGQAELNKVLEGNYSVIMVHSGISYYRVFSQCFVMRGISQEYSYNFAKSVKNVTIRKAEQDDADYLLSPYTTWRFKLDKVISGKGSSLGKFKGKIDLELRGEGCFVDENRAKEKQLEKTVLKDLHFHYELCGELAD